MNDEQPVFETGDGVDGPVITSRGGSEWGLGEMHDIETLADFLNTMWRYGQRLNRALDAVTSQLSEFGQIVDPEVVDWLEHCRVEFAKMLAEQDTRHVPISGPFIE